MKKNYFSLLAAPLVATCCVLPASAKISDLLPLPHKVVATSGMLTLPAQVAIDDAKATPALSRFVSEFGSQATFANSNNALIRVATSSKWRVATTMPWQATTTKPTASK